MRIGLFLLLLGVSVCIQSFEMGVSASQVPPIANVYYTKDGPRIRDQGILYLLGQYIERHTQEETHYRVVKRQDVATLMGQGDLQSICYMTPKRLGLGTDKVVFTKSFLTVKDQLISRKSLPLIKEPSHMRGLTVGIIQGYRYPKLQKLIDTDFLKVEYQNNEVNNFISLFRSAAVDVIVFKDIAFRHFVSTMPEIVGKSALTVHPMELSEAKVSCAIAAKDHHYLPKINSAIEEFIADQSVE